MEKHVDVAVIGILTVLGVENNEENYQKVLERVQEDRLTIARKAYGEGYSDGWRKVNPRSVKELGL